MPHNFSQKIIARWGDDGFRWLALLRNLVADLAQQWQLADLMPMEHLSYHYVLRGQRTTDHTSVVLKLGIDQITVHQEMLALQFYRGNGCVELLEYDAHKGALLLEYAHPGISLKTFFPDHDDATVSYAAGVMKQLHERPVSATAEFSRIKDWLRVLTTNSAAQLPEKHVHQARKLSAHLLDTQRASVLLHGDLHHGNIVSSDRQEWLAIDPKGVIGEPAYEVGAFVRNPMPDLLQQPEPAKIIAHRLDLFADILKIDKQRLKNWSYVQAVLAACWAVEDGEPSQPFMQCAEIIEQI
jgi:streptomycin 6-kinase